MNTPAISYPMSAENTTTGHVLNYVCYDGFTKLESACIALKTTHPDAPEWLNELVRKSREQDLAQAAMQGLVGLNWRSSISENPSPKDHATKALQYAKAMMEEMK